MTQSTQPSGGLEGYGALVTGGGTGIGRACAIRLAGEGAAVKISVDGKEELSACEGDGPVNALDGALRKTLNKFYPTLRTCIWLITKYA